MSMYDYYVDVDEMVDADLAPDRETVMEPVTLGSITRDAFAAFTGTRMVQVYCLARDEGYSGVTPATIAMDTNLTLPDSRRVLANLHRAGYLARLARDRMGSPVYVLPEDVDGRPTVAYEPERSWPDWDDEDIQFAITNTGLDVTVEQARQFLRVLT